MYAKKSNSLVENIWNQCPNQTPENTVLSAKTNSESYNLISCSLKKGKLLFYNFLVLYSLKKAFNLLMTHQKSWNSYNKLLNIKYTIFQFQKITSTSIICVGNRQTKKYTLFFISHIVCNMKSLSWVKFKIRKLILNMFTRVLWIPKIQSQKMQNQRTKYSETETVPTGNRSPKDVLSETPRHEPLYQQNQNQTLQIEHF